MTPNAFITGCDQKTEWMLAWFLTNFRKHNTSPIFFCDFGVSPDVRKWAEKNFDHVYDINRFVNEGLSWSYKPQALITAPAVNKVWIDTDCDVLASIDDAFRYIEPNKLSMVVDRPWTKRRKKLWFNSGVVGVSMCPEILTRWAENCKKYQTIGDQEVLHVMLQDFLANEIYIKEMPNEYNWLRLQLKDGENSDKKRVMHWTGKAGKDVILSYINDSQE